MLLPASGQACECFEQESDRTDAMCFLRLGHKSPSAPVSPTGTSGALGCHVGHSVSLRGSRWRCPMWVLPSPPRHPTAGAEAHLPAERYPEVCQRQEDRKITPLSPAQTPETASCTRWFCSKWEHPSAFWRGRTWQAGALPFPPAPPPSGGVGAVCEGGVFRSGL